MYGQSVESVLAEIDQIDSGRARKNILVLGAGMAGLVAAYELSRLGHFVRVIEAQNRVGGRVLTKRFTDDDYHELGAMRIPASHSYTHYYLKKCNLKTRRFINHHDDKDSYYYIRGIATPHCDAITKLIPQFRLSYRERHMVEQANDPFALMEPLGKAVDEIVRNPAHIAALFATGPMTDYIKKLDSQTLYEFLREHRDTEDAIELIGAVTGLEVWWDKAITMLLRDEIVQQNPRGLDEIIGGTDLLPSSLFERFKDRPNVAINLETDVRSILNHSDNVQLVLGSVHKNGEYTRIDADYVVCTIPFAVLRRLELTGVSAEKMRAIRNLTYASSTKVLFHCKERFWESKYNIYGSGSQQDLINRQVYYPSDTLELGPIIERSPLASVSFQYAIREKKIPAESKKRSGVLVGSYCWGADAR